MIRIPRLLLCTIITVSLCGVLGFSWLPVAPGDGSATFTAAYVEPAANTSLIAMPAKTTSMAALAARDPMALVALGRERYLNEIRDYSCIFTKQEEIRGKLTKKQKIKVLYRDEPKSVYMTWLENADQCRRALYVKGRHVDRKGRELAQVEPNGIIVRLFVKDTLIAISGKRSKKASRRTIDEFGFLSTITLLEGYNRIADERGVLDIRYDGEGQIDGRPTYKLVRLLPYEGPDGSYPDARMVIHLDQEWLLPTAVFSYADQAGTKLLASYVMTDVKFNADLKDSAFQF